MPDVKMPDGTIIRDVPEGTTQAELMARYKRGQAGDQSSDWNRSNVSQLMSGVNEGIALTLGAPVDITNSLLGLGARGVNALAGTNIRMPDNPVGGSETFRGLLSPTIGPATTDPANRFVRRTGQSIGAAAVPVGATAGTPMQAARAMIPAATGGMGAATAQQLFPGSFLAEFGGELLGSGLGLGGLFRSMKKTATRKATEKVPTIPQLKQQADDLYDYAEANGVIANRQQTQGLAGRFQQIAQREGLISPTGRVSTAYPKSKEALDLANDYAQGTMTPTQMKTVRKVLSDAAGNPDSSERRIATLMLKEFDDWTAPLAPELAEARNIASRYLSAGRIDRAMDRAGASAGQFSGSGYENALRTEFRALDKRMIDNNERFIPPVAEAVRKVNRGTPASNAARYVGKLAPTSIVGTGISTGVPFAIGTAATGNPAVGGALSAATSGAGVLGRNAATRMTIKNANTAEAIARNGGKIVIPPTLSARDKRWLAALLAGQSNQYVTKKKR